MISWHIRSPQPDLLLPSTSDLLLSCGVNTREDSHKYPERSEVLRITKPEWAHTSEGGPLHRQHQQQEDSGKGLAQSVSLAFVAIETDLGGCHALWRTRSR